jgi:hypothetical protein
MHGICGEKALAVRSVISSKTCFSHPKKYHCFHVLHESDFVTKFETTGNVDLDSPLKERKGQLISEE